MTIKGSNMASELNNNNVLFTLEQEELSGIGTEFLGPGFSDEDSMRSYPSRGKLQYSMPSFEELLGIPVDQSYQLADFDFLFDGSHRL